MNNYISARSLFSWGYGVRLVLTVLSLLLVLSLALVLIQSSGDAYVRADDTIAPESSSCSGDVDKLTTPWQNAVDGDWNTGVVWNDSVLGDFAVTMVENFSLPSSYSNASWKFEAYHHVEGSLIWKPMKIELWNGSSWIVLYELYDFDHVNETFSQSIAISKSLLSDKVSIRTTIMYSSHVAGAIPPSRPQRLIHYVEYFEGELIASAVPEFPSYIILPSFMIITLLAVIAYRRKHRF
jgi:hypothetical protein